MAPIETEEGFELWPQLSNSKHVVCKWKLSTVYMMDDTSYPCWLVLVPRRKGAEEISKLSENDQQELMREMMKASNALKDLFKPAKMNIAAIGNMVIPLGSPCPPDLRAKPRPRCAAILTRLH